MPATYELQACQIATMPIPGWEVFFARNDVQMYRLSYYVWIVKGNGITGLIDTGLPIDDAERRRLGEVVRGVDPQCVFSDVVLLHQLLQDHNLMPEAIDFVLLTQAITYHSGGLLRELMPRARVYISRAGMMEFLLETPGHPPRDIYFTEAGWAFLRDRLINDRLHLVDAPTEVTPGLVYETTDGHHPGSAGVRVKTSLGMVGILETAFLQGNIDETHPVGVAENVAMCREAIRRYKRECDLVLADHDPGILKRFPGGVIR
jgi:glyoxylase-like metal-dependent hydrolase (beta-lactamase superfamily II)